MTEREKTLLAEKHRKLADILEQLHASWRQHDKIMGDAVVELDTIEAEIGMILAASRIGDEANTLPADPLQQLFKDNPGVDRLCKRLADIHRTTNAPQGEE